jgi:hypothetical protein
VSDETEHSEIPTPRYPKITTLILLAGALAWMPMGLPGTSTEVEAGCFTFADSQCDLISRIDVCYNGFNTVLQRHSYDISVVLAPQVTLIGSCGNGGLQPLNVSPCGTSSSVAAHIINVKPCNNFFPFSVGYRMQAYLPDGTPKKWHTQITINPADFPSIGCTMAYVPVC